MHKGTETLYSARLFRQGMQIFANRAPETFELNYHAHDFIEITYVAEGKGFHHFEDKVLAVSRGDLFVLPVGVSHVFRPASADRQSRLVVYNCTFTEHALEEIANRVGDFDLIAALQLGHGRRSGGYGLADRELTLEPLFERLNDEHHLARPGSAAMLEALLLQLLIQLARKRQPPGGRSDKRELSPPAFNASADPLDEVIDYIRRHPADTLTVRRMAALCRLSERHFLRLFQRRTDQSFHAFVQHARVRRACELLLGTQQTLDAVAAAVGYKDLPSFHRVFKRLVGLTPGQYRKGKAMDSGAAGDA